MKISKILKGFSTWLLLSAMVPLDEPKEIYLWPKKTSDSINNPIPEKVRITDAGEHIISNIHDPSITLFLPDKANAIGTAVIIAPGGGHRELWIDHEGYQPAKWFCDRGIAAFVLKYHLAYDSNSTYTIDKDELADIQRAIRLVRSHSKEWNIDPNKIGVMGFSAGGEVAALSAMRFDSGNKEALDPVDRQSSRPDFQALFYPGGTNKMDAVKNAPPLFIAGGSNDSPDMVEGMTKVYLKYKQSGLSAELHIYANVGHGFGMRSNNKGPVAGWPERFTEWLSDMGLMKKKS